MQPIKWVPRWKVHMPRSPQYPVDNKSAAELSPLLHGVYHNSPWQAFNERALLYARSRGTKTPLEVLRSTPNTSIFRAMLNNIPSLEQYLNSSSNITLLIPRDQGFPKSFTKSQMQKIISSPMKCMELIKLHILPVQLTNFNLASFGVGSVPQCYGLHSLMNRTPNNRGRDIIELSTGASYAQLMDIYTLSQTKNVVQSLASKNNSHINIMSNDYILSDKQTFDKITEDFQPETTPNKNYRQLVHSVAQVKTGVELNTDQLSYLKRYSYETDSFFPITGTVIEIKTNGYLENGSRKLMLRSNGNSRHQSQILVSDIPLLKGLAHVISVPLIPNNWFS